MPTTRLAAGTAKDEFMYSTQYRQPDGRWLTTPGEATEKRWRARVLVADQTGKATYMQSYAKTKEKAKAALKAKVARFLEDDIHEDARFGPNTSISEVAKVWLDERRAHRDSGVLAWNSYRVYELSWTRYLDKALGRVTLKRVTHDLVQGKISAIAAESGAGAARTCKSVISGILELARAGGGLDVNPVLGVRIANARKRERTPGKKVKFLDEGQLAKLRSYLQSTPTISEDVVLAVEIQLATGIRVGEVCGLTWTNVDFEQQRLYIEFNAFRKTGDGVQLGDLKVDGTDRWLHVGPHIMGLLHEHMVMTKSEDDMVLHAAMGGILDPVRVQHELASVFDAIGMKGANSHILRRTAATKLIDRGVAVTDVAAQLGHSGISTTMRYYVGVKGSGPRSAADFLEPDA